MQTLGSSRPPALRSDPDDDGGRPFAELLAKSFVVVVEGCDGNGCGLQSAL
jgi:hypothetical protein